MQNVWQLQIDHFKICVWNHLSNTLNLWNKSKTNKELRGTALSFVYCKWRTGVKSIQIARADFVIKCVLCSTTQNLSCLPWCQFEQKKDNFNQETPLIFSPLLILKPQNPQQIIFRLEAFTMTACIRSLLDLQFLYSFFSPHNETLSMFVGWAGLASGKALG